MALALGKALNNPAEAMNSLGRVGVKFTAQQQKAVKQLVATGQSAKAQEFILRQLESRYAGSAKTLGNTQPLKQLTNAFNDMLEPLGQLVQEFLTPLVQKATVLIGVFNNFPKPVKATVVSIMGIIAIASPLLMIIGGVISAFGSIVTAVGGVIVALHEFHLISKIATGFQAFCNTLKSFQIMTKTATATQWLFNTSLYACPIVWIIAGVIAIIAIIVLLIKNWDNVVKYLQFVWDFWKQFFSGLWQSITEFATGFWKGITEAVTNIWKKVQEVFGAIKAFIKEHFIQILLTALGPIGLIIQGIMKVKDLIGKIGSESIKVEQQINASDATNKNTVDLNGKIEVSATNGSKVNSTSSKTKSKGKGRFGFNLAKAGT
jgi:phage-related minor tail protein